MDLNKEIRETIEFYCGGTYENRKLAADKILQICKNKPLAIHSVVNQRELLLKEISNWLMKSTTLSVEAIVELEHQFKQ